MDGSSRILGLRGQASRRAISDTLVAAVGARRLKPGATYLEADLAAELGVSAGALGQVLIVLTTEGLIEPVGEGRFRVSAPTVAELRDMIELRLLIEVPAVRKVADQELSHTDIGHLDRLAHATMQQARRSDVLGYINADMVFHLRLLDLAGNPQLVEVVRVLRSRSRLHGLDDAEHAWFMAENAAEHAELVDLVTQGNASAAGDLLSRHIARIAVGWPVSLPPGYTVLEQFSMEAICYGRGHAAQEPAAGRGRQRLRPRPQGTVP